MDLDWVGFELHPGTPKGGMRVTDMFGEQRVAAFRGQLEQAAARVGVPLGQPTRIPNSRRALALAEQARDAGTLQVARNALMDAHWLHARDIESDAVLAEVAALSGLDPVAAVAACDSPRWQARVDAMRAEAAAWGVTGIPTFFFLPDGWTVDGMHGWTGPQPLRVVGAQPLPLLRDAVRRIGAAPR